MRFSARNTLLATCLCLLLGTAANAQVIILSTGLDASNTLLTTSGALDAHWTVPPIAGGPAGPAQVITPSSVDWFGGWLANGPNSDWIARDASVADQGATPYTFTRTFDLSGYDLTTVGASGSWTIDDVGVLELNGVPIASLGAGTWGALTPFIVPTGSPLFHSGINTLTMTMTSSDRFLEGVRLEGTLTGQLVPASVPEPGSMAMLAVLLPFALGAGVRRLRRRG